MPYHAGQRPGTRPHAGGHPGRLGAPFVAPRPAIVCAPGRAFGPPFLRTSRPAAPGPLPLRSAASARRARRRFAGPFRRFAPSGLSALPGPAPRGFPPGSPARGPARGPFPASVPARCRRCPGLALAARRAPCSVALASSRARPLGFASARRVPPAPSAARLRGRLAPAPGACAALRAACLGLRPPGLCLRARACAGLLCASPAAFWVSVGSPLRPPAPPPPLGAPGGVRPVRCFAPALGRASRAPLAGPPVALAGPRPALSARLTVRKL